MLPGKRLKNRTWKLPKGKLRRRSEDTRTICDLFVKMWIIHHVISVLKFFLEDILYVRCCTPNYLISTTMRSSDMSSGRMSGHYSLCMITLTGNLKASVLWKPQNDIRKGRVGRENLLVWLQITAHQHFDLQLFVENEISTMIDKNEEFFSSARSIHLR